MGHALTLLPSSWRLPTFAVLSIVGLSSAVPSAAAQVDQTPTITVTRRLVVLDVEITDKKTASPVSSLQASDIAVLEDGQSRPIEHFEEHTGVETSSVNKRIFVLDALNTPFDEATYAEKSIQAFLTKQPPTLPGPVSIVVLDDRGLHTLAPLSTSREALLQGLHSYHAVLPSSLARGDKEHLIIASVYTLRQLALANASSQERNVIIWVGRGFPSIALDTLPQESVDRFNALLENLTTNLLDARITLSRVDTAPAGTAFSSPLDTDLTETFDTSPEPFADSFSFGSLIDQTGGEVLYNRNDIDQEVAEAARAASSYYTLAYTPEPDTDRKDIYRHIRIVLKRPGLHAETRRGYFTHPPDFKALGNDAIRSRLSGAISNGLNYTSLDLSLRLRMTAGGHQTITLSSSVPAGIAIPGRPLTFHVGVARFDDHGKALNYTHTELTQNPDQVHDNSVTLTFPVEGPGAAKRTRIVVLEPLSGDLGSLDLNRSPSQIK